MTSNKHVLLADLASEVAANAADHLAAKGWQITRLSGRLSGGQADADYSCDLQNRHAVVQMLSDIEKERGPIYGLFFATPFNSPGKGFLNTSLDEWQQRLDAWLGQATNICYACGNLMLPRKEGRIMVLTPDFKAVEGDCTVEATAAGSLHGFLKSYGAEVAENLICVNGIYASLPFDFEAINATCDYLLGVGGDYVSAQLVSIAGKG